MFFSVTNCHIKIFTTKPQQIRHNNPQSMPRVAVFRCLNLLFDTLCNKAQNFRNFNCLPQVNIWYRYSRLTYDMLVTKLSLYLQKNRLLHHLMPFRSQFNTTYSEIKDYNLEKIKDAQFLRQMVINSEIDAAVTTTKN